MPRLVMKFKTLILALICLLAISPVQAADRSDGLKPRWITSSLPVPKSPGYIFISAQGSGSSLEEARLMAVGNLITRLEHERGISVNSNVKTEKHSQRGSSYKNKEITFEVSEKGKTFNITCRVVDEYWERVRGRYIVTQLYTVNDLSRPAQGSYNDHIRLTTSYGAAPMFYSLIPGVGQFVKGNNVKGGIFLGTTAVGAAAIVFCENQRAIYAKKMKEHPQHFDFYRNRKANWEVGRNVSIGVTGAVYLWNLIDAAVAPGRRRVIVSRGRSYNYSFAPVVMDRGVGVGFAMNF